MQETLQSIFEQLNKTIQITDEKLSDQLFSQIPNKRMSPSFNKEFLILKAQLLLNFITERQESFVEDDKTLEQLSTIESDLEFFNSKSLIDIAAHPEYIVASFILLMDSIKTRLDELLPLPDLEEISKRITALRRRTTSAESRLNAYDTNVGNLEEKVQQINDAHEAAHSLPTDLEDLAKAKKKIDKFKEEAEEKTSSISKTAEVAKEKEKYLKELSNTASKILKRADEALSKSTSVGLAAAFDERSKSLNRSIYIWVAGLIASLGAGSYLGANQVSKMTDILSNPNSSVTIIIVNLILSFISVAAPIWFAWLATKQIGHRFKLSEDYAFKASISRAYEGYRREASRIDGAMQESEELAQLSMESKLLLSALTRLDEIPLRLLDSHTHGSPWSEFLSSKPINDAIKTIPGFAGEVARLADDKLQSLKPKRPHTSTKKTKSDESESPELEE